MPSFPIRQQTQNLQPAAKRPRVRRNGPVIRTFVPSMGQEQAQVTMQRGQGLKVNARVPVAFEVKV